MRNVNHQLHLKGLDARSLGTDANSLGTDAYSVGTDAFSTGNDAYTLGTAAPTGRAVSIGPYPYCEHYHGRWHKACEASKAEKRNGKKRGREA